MNKWEWQARIPLSISINLQKFPAIMHILFVYLKCDNIDAWSIFFLSVLRMFCSRWFISKTYNIHVITGILHVVSILNSPNSVRQQEVKHDPICIIRRAWRIIHVFVICSMCLVGSAEIQSWLVSKCPDSLTYPPPLPKCWVFKEKLQVTLYFSLVPLPNPFITYDITC